ncbi:hypothetical protein KC19_6G047900 [Ceratodon purpureus]|uniref:NAD-dependent epimerase/dehydratase domain-containing protein n=1 Tax=Ceratodon purpureus TaxID=3225 RepID=A0A8T0HC39_CERPU|nr:hypothetical protein KC19_6G047900 [Ceratodon purpureus]
MAPAETVCVTGASGFIASWIVKMLLEKGYNVKGTVRNLESENAKFLRELPGASERLELFAVDVMKPGLLDSIFEGCDGIFHTANPTPSLVGGKVADPEAIFVETALKGTLNVLESCVKARPKRIVLTSSIVSCLLTPKNVPGAVIDETFVTDPDFVRKVIPSGDFASYAIGKTLAEKVAWDFVKKHNLSMVVMNPAYVIGPTVLPTVNTTNEVPLEFLNGNTKTIKNESGCWVGVKDVAMAHILGYEKPEAEGRYILCEKVMHLGDFASLLQKLFPQYNVVAREDPNAQPRATPFLINNEKVKELGVNLQPLEDVLRELVESLKELKYLN